MEPFGREEGPLASRPVLLLKKPKFETPEDMEIYGGHEFVSALRHGER